MELCPWLFFLLQGACRKIFYDIPIRYIFLKQRRGTFLPRTAQEKARVMTPGLCGAGLLPCRRPGSEKNFRYADVSAPEVLLR